jgi:dCMP deaminase
MADYAYWSDVQDGYLSDKDLTERISWTDYFKEICETTAKRSCCSRLKVGCILVKDNRIISQGYNGYLPGFPHESIIKDGHEVATVHAEQNTIIDCAKRGVSCEGCEAYITHFPCLTCTKMLLAAGVKKIYYINDYNNDSTVYNFIIPETYYVHCSKHAKVQILKI